jgi:hypothetical protein
MNTNSKVILAAVGIAVLASPAMAQSESNSHRSAIYNARGSVTRTHPSRAFPVQSRYQLEDCIHVQFPQCGGAHEL